MARNITYRISDLTPKEDALDTEIVLPNGQIQALRYVETGLYKHLYISGYSNLFDIETEDITPDTDDIQTALATSLGFTQSDRGSIGGSDE
ncbi:MAG: hypothetical protein BGO69_15885 [Bacteroidetes bacterium 46-16]|nr:MAG: hypothetical protein BGO69_15885 [Bacteroidetes bacterium 46-16]